MDYFIPTAIIGVILGWFLGLLAPAIQDRIKQGYLKKSIRRGILTEIAQLREAAADVVFIVQSKLGNLDRELLKWHRDIRSGTSTRTLPPAFAQMQDVTDALLKAEDSAIPIFAQRMAMKPGEGLNLKEFDLPYTRSKLGQLELLSENARLHILDLLHRISIINQQVADSRFYYKMTFDSGLSEKNHKSIAEQCTGAYESVAQQARLLVELCEAATTDIKKQC